MNDPHSSRRDFLKASALAGLTASIAGCSAPNPPCGATATEPAALRGGVSVTRPRPSGGKPVHDLTTQPLEKVRVGVIGLNRGMAHLDACLDIECCEITAVCDLRDDRAKHAAAECVKAGAKFPAIYSGTEHVWEKMVERDDMDVVYIATPWAWHVPMALAAMQHGKHAFVEVPAAVTVEDCWSLVDASEKTRRHCVLLENCCYGETEMFVLNMAMEGVFGELTHAECAYLHDLRQVLFSLGEEGDWRRDYHWKYNGNLYPTHGLGPVAQYLGIGRGDQFQSLVSMSSAEKSLTLYRDAQKPNGGIHAGEKYLCGDMNTSIIKTVLGRTIMIQHDVVSPRPYSRVNALYGTGGTFMDYPARLALDNPGKHGLKAEDSEAWLEDGDMKTMREKFTHPLWRKLRERARDFGHDGMDFVINWDMMHRLHEGRTPDSVVYDAAAWSSIIELSSRSAAAGAPVPMPDFGRELWRTLQPSAIAG
jgi:hypothetical protein